MTKDASATAIAISNGTPTITACEWCIGGFPFSFNILILSFLSEPGSKFRFV
jgi:hypothetical protein